MPPPAPNPRRLVILGCGYIGTALAQAALARGWTISALTRNAERAAALRALGVAPVVEASLASAAWHTKLDPSGAAVVNAVSPANREIAGYEQSFIAGTRSITRWLEKSRGARHPPATDLVFTSATSVYPQADGSWVDESTPLDSVALTPAGAILLTAEDLHLALAPLLARRGWVLRLGGLYGPGRHYLLESLRSGQRVFPGRGDCWVNLLHRDDAVAALLACLDAPATVPGGRFNAVDDNPVLKQDLLLGLARLLGIDAATVRCDPALVSDRARRRETPAGATPHRCIANGRLKQLGWSLVYPSFEVGFRSGLTPP